MSEAKRVRLMIDFNTAEDLAEFVTGLRLNQQVPDDVGVYEADALDFSREAGGVTRKYTYLLRREGNEGRKRLILNKQVEI